MADIEFQMIRHGQREETHFSFSYTPVRNPQGDVAGVFCACEETTAQVRSARALRAAEEQLHLRAASDLQRFRNLVAQAPGVIAILSGPEHVFELANEAYMRLVGNRALLGRTAREALPETVQQGFIDLLDSVYRSGTGYVGRNERLLLRRPGSGQPEEYFVDFIYQPITGDDGEVTGIFVEGHDVTARKRVEDELRETSERLAVILDSATDYAILTTDVDRKVTLWNPGAEKITGWSSQDILGNAADRIFTPEDRAAGVPEAETRRARESGRAADERWHVRKDGSRFWASGLVMPLLHRDGSLAGFLKIMRERTTERQAEEVLRTSEAQFRSLAESIPQLAWIAQPDGEVVWFNRRFYEYTGATLESMRGDGWRSIHHPVHAQRVMVGFRDAFAAGVDWEDTFPLRGRDGRFRWFLSRAVPIRDSEGRVASWFGTNTDVTEQREAEEMLERRVDERTAELAATNRQLLSQIEEREEAQASLRQLQRLEAVGQLTSGVAHDFNNLLQIIVGNVGILKRVFRDLGVDEKYRQRLDHMAAAADRGARLTAQLLAFSRRQRLEPRPTDLNDTVEGMVGLLRSSIGGTVKLQMQLQDGLWRALVDPTQIELVILNLAVNARDAMEVGGDLVIRTRNVAIAREPVRPEEPVPGEYVMLSVCDDGSGMSAEVRAKVFEPFFTTKEVGKGSGLGLSQVLGFAKQSRSSCLARTPEAAVRQRSESPNRPPIPTGAGGDASSLSTTTTRYARSRPRSCAAPGTRCLKRAAAAPRWTCWQRRGRPSSCC
jgi:PAS domain S-box-containing protein